MFKSNSNWKYNKLLENEKIDVDCLKEFIKNKVILKTQQRFKSERPNVFTEETNKIALTSSDDKRMQSINSIETFAYGTRKDVIRKKGKNKRNNIIKQYKNV